MRRDLGARAIAAALVAGSLATAEAAAASLSTAFRNPIAPVRADASGAPARGLDSPDPWIFTFRGRYHLTTTAGNRIILRSASTLGGLASAPVVRVWPRSSEPVPASRCCGFWAPEFHRLKGPSGWRWYVYSAADNGNLLLHRMQVLESEGDDPRGPYAFKGILALGENYAIDASVFSVRGRRYVVYSGGRGNVSLPAQLYIARLSNPWTVDRGPIQISEPTLPWETENAPINEGPEALRRGPWLHLIYSASPCLFPQYKLGRLTVRAGADLLDPATWADAKAPEPVFQGDASSGVWATGHGSFFRSPDGREDWQVYHATDGMGPTCFGGLARTTRAQRFTWNRDGTPRFGRPISLRTDLRAPSGDPTLARQTEGATVLASSSDVGHRTVRDPGFVGARGTALDAQRAGDFVTYALKVPRAGRYRVLVRLITGPQQGRVRLDVAGMRSPGGSRDAYTERTRYRELDFGTLALARGKAPFRFAVTGRAAASGGYRFTADQVRLVPRAAR